MAITKIPPSTLPGTTTLAPAPTSASTPPGTFTPPPIKAGNLAGSTNLQPTMRPGAFPTVPTAPKAPGPAAPGAAAAPDPLAMYKDLLSAHDSDSAKERDEINRNSALAMNAASRRADVVNARMGRSIAGGYAGLQSQAMIGGMEQQRKALAEQGLRSGDKRRQLQLDYLDKQLEQKYRQEDRDFEVSQGDTQRAHELTLAGLNVEGGTLRKTDAINNWAGQVNDLKAKLDPTKQAELDKLWTSYQQGLAGSGPALQDFFFRNGVNPTNTSERKRATEAAESQQRLRQFMQDFS